MNIDLEQLRDLMKAMSEFDVAEVELKKDDERITLRRPSSQVAPVITTAVAPSIMPAPAAAAAAPAAAAAAPAEAEEDDANITYITSPFVGTYYEAPSPDAPAFVQVGQKIQSGTVLCIVEAMKLMNEIESEISGEIVEILGENGKPVEYGDRLFKVRTA